MYAALLSELKITYTHSELDRYSLKHIHFIIKGLPTGFRLSDFGHSVIISLEKSMLYCFQVGTERERERERDIRLQVVVSL